MGLAEVKDYIFLSACDMTNTFIVERSGRVRLYIEGEAPPTPVLRKEAELPCLLQINDFLTGEPAWSWENGYLPILNIVDANNNRVKLLAWNEQLLLQTGTKAFVYPGGEEIDRGKFHEAETAITAYWRNWFASGLQLPAIAPDWDQAWRSCIVQSKCAFQYLHPKYGVEKYGEFRADAFPPAVMSMVTMLLEFAHYAEARAMTAYYFDRFIRADGTIDYYGPAISEYAGLLLLAARLGKTDGEGRQWLEARLPVIKRILYYLYDLMNRWMHPGGSKYQLITGSPEADTRDDKDEYFHNNLLVLRAFYELLPVLTKFTDPMLTSELKHYSGVLEQRLRQALTAFRKRFAFLPYRMAQEKEIESFTAARDFAYANYRYYPEMLQSALLSPSEALKIIEARENLNGEEFGMTVLGWDGYGPVYDHWPLLSYAQGLLEINETERFDRTLNAHFYNYQSRDTFTAYETVSREGNPRYAVSDWCVPAQLTLPVMLKWKLNYTPYSCRHHLI